MTVSTERRRQVLAMTLGALAVSACGTRRPEVHPHPTKEMLRPNLDQYAKLTHHPAVGTQATVEVGVNMAYVTSASEVPVVELVAPLRHIVQHHHYPIAFDTYEGAKPLVGVAYDGEFFGEGNLKASYQDEKTKVWTFDHVVPGGIFLHRDGNRYLWWKWDGYPIYIDWIKELKVNLTTKTVANSGPALRRELVYTGVSQSTVSLLYREFINDMARPAFSQDLRYDISQSRTIGYQGARFEIIRADNTGLTYRVLSHLPAPAR